MSRILVIEDDERIGQLITRALENEGFATQRESTGTNGLTTALAQNFDLIVLDLTLPGMDGRTVLQRLVDERPEQQVLVLSALPDIGTRLAVLAAGAADFLGKPFALAELLARVCALLGSAP